MLSEILTVGEKALASFVMRFSLFDSISNSYKSKYREPVSFGIDDLREKINLSPNQAGEDVTLFAILDVEFVLRSC